MKERAWLKNGSVLILALWSICLLSTFAVYLGYNVRQKLILVKDLETRSALTVAAESGIKKTIAEIKDLASEGVFCLKHDLANNPELFKDVALADGLTYSVTHSGFFGVINEESKINLNLADWQVLKKLFMAMLCLDETACQDLACSIVDWRDADSSTVVAGSGAEKAFYNMLDPAYDPKNSDFERLEELLLVKGIDQELFDKIKDLVTIYGNGKVNINTAPRPVLIALGLTPDLADKICAYRAGKDGAAGTVDDNVFDSVSGLIGVLSGALTLSQLEINSLTDACNNYLTTEADFFMIECVAAINQKNKRKIACVADNKGRVVYWREY